MKHIFTPLALLCLAVTASVHLNAQQDPQFTQYNHNRLFYNPAYAGIKQALCITAIARNQWIGFEGAPKSGALTGELYLEDLSGGIALSLMYDELGFEKNMSYRFAYSFHRERIFNGTLAFGIEAGAATKILGPAGGQSWLAGTNWMYDPSVPPRISKTAFDAGIGIWYEHKKMWMGISASHLNAAQLNQGNVVVNANPNLNISHSRIYTVARHYWITGGYNLIFRTWTVSPSFLVKSDANVTALDISVNAEFADAVWFGADYRHGDALCPFIGYIWETKINKESNRQPVTPRNGKTDVAVWKIGCAYDFNTSKLNDYNNGTFEIFLNYCMPWAPASSRHGDVRNFR